MNHWQKWAANGLIIFAMVALLSPTVASGSYTPWVAFLLANVIYLYDSIQHKNWPWMWLCIFCGAWDTLLIISRTTDTTVLTIFTPLLSILEKLP
jgi:hypothetical protein